MELRPAAVEDLPALHLLFLAAIRGVFEPHAFAAPAPPLEVFSNQQQHVLATGTSVVATAGDDVLGFASSWARGVDWFLASLFVAPGAQGRGTGRMLLDAVWGEGRLRRRTITDSIQPISNALYGRRGLVPATPLLEFSGEPRGARALLERGEGDELAEIDAAAYGFDRAIDHAYWARFARRTVWLRADSPVAYSYAFPGGVIGPVAGLDPHAAAAALAGELACASGPVAVRVPGSSRALVEVALASGLQLTPTPGLLLLSERATPPAALAIASFTLF